MEQQAFLQVTVENLPDDDIIREMVLSVLLNYGFDSFWEDGALIHGYIDASQYNEQDILSLIADTTQLNHISLSSSPLENRNWNEEWEKHFDPVTIDDSIYVYAPFHEEKPHMPYSICIMPKMSFGTAHHGTTASVLKLMLSVDFQNKTVIDAGTGTGILAIFAEMRGAGSIFAYDNDDWSVSNAIENTERNQCRNIDIKKGENELLAGKQCDVLIANIHRNVILGDLPHYRRCLSESGILILSGFYTDDLADITEACESHGMAIDCFIVNENWVAARFIVEN